MGKQDKERKRYLKDNVTWNRSNKMHSANKKQATLLSLTNKIDRKILT
jgi:hypothetical protein